MTELARGSVNDRPWGQTLGALGLRGLSGQLTLGAEGKQYRIAFARGAVIGAASPLASDAAVRVALTSHLVTSTQVAELTRRLAAAPNREEIEVIAELAKLAPDQTQRLRRRIVAQRAARTFSIDRGEFIIDDRVTVPVLPGSELDVRTIIYMGARTNLSEARLADELRELGAWFQLKPDAAVDLPQFGFTDAEQPIVMMLVGGANLTELEAAAPELGTRGAHAAVYALAACGACTVDATPHAPREVAPTQARAPTPQPSPPSGRVITRDTIVPRITTRELPPRPQTASSSPTELRREQVPRSTTTPPPTRARTTGAPAEARTRTPSILPGTDGLVRLKPPSAPPPGTEDVVRMRVPTGAPATEIPPPRSQPSSSQPPITRKRSSSTATVETEALIAERLPLLESRADHFALLGVPFDAPVAVVRASYFNLARKLHPDRLASLGISDAQRNAQRLFANINAAFAVLADPARRKDYVAMIQRGGESVMRAEEAEADALATRVMRAEEAFRQGEMALRRDQIEQALVEFTTAAELQPNEPEYQALLTWVKFAAAPDKMAVAAMTRQQLAKSASAMEASPTARFYLGRVERMLGREKEALAHFHAVLEIKPGHVEASSEVRILESRLKSRR